LHLRATQNSNRDILKPFHHENAWCPFSTLLLFTQQAHQLLLRTGCTFLLAQENRLMWLSFTPAHASIIRCGWNAVTAIGAERLLFRKLEFEYGSKLDRNVPSKLWSRMLCFSEPLPDA